MLIWKPGSRCRWGIGVATHSTDPQLSNAPTPRSVSLTVPDKNIKKQHPSKFPRFPLFFQPFSRRRDESLSLVDTFCTLGCNHNSKTQRCKPVWNCGIFAKFEKYLNFTKRPHCGLSGKIFEKIFLPLDPQNFSEHIIVPYFLGSIFGNLREMSKFPWPRAKIQKLWWIVALSVSHKIFVMIDLLFPKIGGGVNNKRF